MQFSKVTADSIRTAWMNFRIPFEFPPIMDRFISFNESRSVKDELADAVPETPSHIGDWSLPNHNSTPYPAPPRNRLTPSVLAEKRRCNDEHVEAGGSVRQKKRHMK